MVSATGSGELLFTPRIGSLYGYPLLWAPLAAVVVKWFANSEVGRYTVCTGASIALVSGVNRESESHCWSESSGWRVGRR
jgi:Mn2+/Fe2+ NRAMP family transporter